MQRLIWVFIGVGALVVSQAASGKAFGQHGGSHYNAQRSNGHVAAGHQYGGNNYANYGHSGYSHVPQYGHSVNQHVSPAAGYGNNYGYGSQYGYSGQSYYAPSFGSGGVQHGYAGQHYVVPNHNGYGNYSQNVHGGGIQISSPHFGLRIGH